MINDVKEKMLQIESTFEKYLNSEDFEKDMEDLCSTIQKDGRENAKIYIMANVAEDGVDFEFVTETGNVQKPLGYLSKFEYWDISVLMNILDERLERDINLYRTKKPDEISNMKVVMLPESITYERSYVTHCDYLICTIWTRKLWKDN